MKTLKLNSIKGLVLIFALGIFIFYACKKDKPEEPTPDTTPVADFTADTTIITAGDTVNFTDLSTNTPTSWSWDFGDSAASTLQNPSHTYITAGTYTVSFTATNAYGSDNETKLNYINVNVAGFPPITNFTSNTTIIVEGGTVNFTDLSTNTPTNWSWDFGDVGTSSLQNPSHTYTTAGAYTVSLTATNAYGSNNETKLNYINVTGINCPTTVTDTGGNVYNVVKIGNQCWMAENLNVGTQIPPASNQTNNGIIEKYCHGGVHLSSTEGDCSVWGGLYQWNEMMQYVTTEGTQGICPTGWHIPTDAEWCILENFLDATTDPGCSLSGQWRGTDCGTKLKQGGSSGYDALLAGYRHTDGLFYYSGAYEFMWSSTESGSGAWNRYLSLSGTRIARLTNSKLFGFSVRCVKD